VKEAGAQLGLWQLRADTITKILLRQLTRSGDPHGANRCHEAARRSRRQFGGWQPFLTQSNSFQLTGKIGRRPTDGELLYGAISWGSAAAPPSLIFERRGQSAGPSGARPVSERRRGETVSIFYRPQGGRGPRSVSEVYSVLTLAQLRPSAAQFHRRRATRDGPPVGVNAHSASNRRSPSAAKLRRSTMQPNLVEFFRIPRTGDAG